MYKYTILMGKLVFINLCKNPMLSFPSLGETAFIKFFYLVFILLLYKGKRVDE